jgi:hypothetical protein
VQSAQGAGAGHEVTDRLETGTPRRGLGGVGDEHRRPPGDFGEQIDQAIEDGAAAEVQQALGSPAEPAGGAAGQDRAADDQ